MSDALAAHLCGVTASAAFACAAAVLAVCLSWALNRWRFRSIPGPFAPPLIGNLLQLSKLGTHEYLDRCRRRYGRLFKVYAGSKMFIIVADPELARRVLIKLHNHEETLGPPLTADRRAIKEVQRSKTIFCARDDEWRALRAAWQPAFSPAALQGYTSLMDDCALRLAGVLEDAAREGRAVDMCSEMGRMTLSVVGTCAYGVDFRTLGRGHAAAPDAEAEELVAASQRFFKTGVTTGSHWNRLLLLFPAAKRAVQWLAARLPDRPLVELTEARATIIDASTQLVKQWRAANPPGGACCCKADDASKPWAAAPLSARASDDGTLSTSSASSASSSPSACGSPEDGAAAGLGSRRCSVDSSSGDGGSRSSSRGGTAGGRRGAAQMVPGGFLGLLLGSNGGEAGGADGAPQFDDKTIIAQSNGFMLAGFETTANTLAYAVWAISAHPRVQARVLAEVDAFGRSRPPGFQDLQQQGGAFPYLQAVIKETLRLLPSVPLMHREVTRDEGFQLMPGLVVPKGERLYTAMYCYQRDEAFWPRPLEFLPERFLQEGSALAPSTELALTPFGGGARLCIGYRFAQQEALLTLVRLYQRMTFELEPGMVPLRLHQHMTLCPKDGVMARPALRPA